MAVPKNLAGEMVGEVIEFTRCYTLWRELMDPSNRDARTNHMDFLLTVSISLQMSFCVQAFQLFDKNNKTKSLRRLIEKMRSSNSALANQLAAAINAQEALLAKVFRLRNNVYAHRNDSRHPRDFFADVALTPKQMKEIVELAQNVISDIAAAAGVGKKEVINKGFQEQARFILTDTRDVLRILGDLPGVDLGRPPFK